MYGLTCDAQRLRYFGPRPAGGERLLDRGILQLVGEFSQRHDGGQLVRLGVKRTYCCHSAPATTSATAAMPGMTRSR